MQVTPVPPTKGFNLFLFDLSGVCIAACFKVGFLAKTFVLVGSPRVAIEQRRDPAIAYRYQHQFGRKNFSTWMVLSPSNISNQITVWQ